MCTAVGRACTRTGWEAERVFCSLDFLQITGTYVFATRVVDTPCHLKWWSLQFLACTPSQMDTSFAHVWGLELESTVPIV